MLRQLRDWLWQIDICIALERSTLAGCTCRLHDGVHSFLRKPEPGKANALTLQIGDLGCKVRPHRGLYVRVGRTRELDDAPLLEALRNGQDQQPGRIIYFARDACGRTITLLSAWKWR